MERNGDPTSSADLMPEVLRRIWARGHKHRAATWTCAEVEHIERLLSDSLPPAHQATPAREEK